LGGWYDRTSGSPGDPLGPSGRKRGHARQSCDRIRDARRAGRDISELGWTNAENSPQAFAWFNDLEAAILSLDDHPQRSAATPEDKALRHLLFGNKANVYRGNLPDRRARPDRAGIAHPSGVPRALSRLPGV
jgi:hypothetical protein